MNPGWKCAPPWMQQRAGFAEMVSAISDRRAKATADWSVAEVVAHVGTVARLDVSIVAPGGDHHASADFSARAVLGGDQADVAARFAGHGVDRLAQPKRWHWGPLGVPLSDGAVACLVCESYRVITIGDHWLLVGLVIGAELGGASSPRPYHGAGAS